MCSKPRYYTPEEQIKESCQRNTNYKINLSVDVSIRNANILF